MHPNQQQPDCFENFQLLELRTQVHKQNAAAVSKKARKRKQGKQ
jgi:hypothetical protein